MSTTTVAALKKRCEQAWQRRRLYDMMLWDVYDYVLPFRDVSGLHATNRARAEGQSRTDRIFDSTAVRAAFRFAGRLQSELTPPFQTFFALEAGPLLPDGGEKKKLTEELMKIASAVHGVLSTGNYHNAAHEMYLDLFAGTAAMQILAGNIDYPVRTRVVPLPEIALEEGPFGDVWGVVWRKKWPSDELKVLWPKAKFCDALKTIMEAAEPTMVEVTQYTRYRPDEGGNSGHWELLVWSEKCTDGAEPFHREKFRTSPWIVPRFFKVPGEVYGRGPAQLAMANVKTMNKARELALKAAALSVMGIWTARDDGVFNPDTVRFEPLAMWRVASNGGPMGKTVEPLDVPRNFDISTIVIADEREQAKQALFDDTLPADTGAVRSATEIAERMRRLSQDFSGVNGRLTLEIVVATVRRVIDVLETLGVLKTSLKIDQLLTQVRVVAPIAAGQQAAKVQSLVNWQEIVGRLHGPKMAMVATRPEKFVTRLARHLGVEEDLIAEEETIKKAIAAEVAMGVQQHQAEVAKAMPQGEPPAPGQAYINGGGA